MADREEIVYSLKDLLRILPFGKTKLLSLCQRNIIPVTKIGKSYFITKTALEKWLHDNEGKEIIY